MQKSPLFLSAVTRREGALAMARECGGDPSSGPKGAALGTIRLIKWSGSGPISPFGTTESKRTLGRSKQSFSRPVSQGRAVFGRFSEVIRTQDATWRLNQEL
jgi:hypothetical protein